MIVQKVRPSIRLLCLGVGVLLLTMTIASWRAGNGARDIGGMGLFAGLFLLLGTVGSLEDADDPPARNASTSSRTRRGRFRRGTFGNRMSVSVKQEWAHAPCTVTAGHLSVDVAIHRRG